MTLPPLRDYQARALAQLQDAARRWAVRKSGYGLLAVAPTGAGKTRLALELATRSIAKGRQVLWLAPRTELIDQPVERLRASGWTDVRVLQADRPRGTGPITVASIQTLVARQETPPAELVILDEGRHYAAATWGQIAQAYLGAVRVGLDATPARADGAALGDLFDELVEVASIAELTRDGWLVPARVIAPESYQDKLAADPVEAYLEHTPQGRALCFCQSRRHAKDTAAAFVAAGVAAVAVDSHSSTRARARAVEGIRSGALSVLCNVQLFTEGFDAPGIDTIIAARGVAHAWTWLQMIGRGLRPADGRARGAREIKEAVIDRHGSDSPYDWGIDCNARTGRYDWTTREHCTVLDLRGHCHRHGWPDDARSWHLEGKPLTQAEGLPAAVQCPECHCWSRGGGPCPVCGATKPDPPPPRLSKAELAERRRERQPRVGPDWELWRELVTTARDRGYKPQWASLRYKARTGRWPRWGVAQVRDET